MSHLRLIAVLCLLSLHLCTLVCLHRPPGHINERRWLFSSYSTSFSVGQWNPCHITYVKWPRKMPHSWSLTQVQNWKCFMFRLWLLGLPESASCSCLWLLGLPESGSCSGLWLLGLPKSASCSGLWLLVLPYVEGSRTPLRTISLLFVNFCFHVSPTQGSRHFRNSVSIWRFVMELQLVQARNV